MNKVHFKILEHEKDKTSKQLCLQSMLEERQMCGQDHELTRVRPIQISSIPDTLYMVEDPQYIQQFMTFNPTPLHNIDIVSGTIPGLCSRRVSVVHFKFCINGFILRFFKRHQWVLHCKILRLTNY